MLLIVALSLVAFVAACIGLGRLAQGLAPGAGDPALSPLIGAVAFIWISSVANALGVFHVEIVLALVADGLAALAWTARGWRPTRADIAAQGLPAAVVAGAIGLMLFIPPEINLNDDGPAYLLFSEKLRLLGATGPEPFSERRLYTLGGQFGLVATVTQLFGTRWLSAYEPAMGLALIAAVVWLRDRSRPVAAAIKLAVVLGLAVVSLVAGAKPVANLAPAILYGAFLFGLSEAWLSQAASARDGRSAGHDLVLAAVFAATALTLRPTALPFIALLAVAGAVLAARRGRWVEIGVAAAAAIVVLGPSLWVSLRDTGTALYPFLGPGGHAPDLYSTTSVADVARMASVEWIAFALAALVPVATLAMARTRPAGAWVLSATTLLAVILVAWPTGALKLARYSFPFVYAVLASLIMRLRMPSRTPPAWVAAATAGVAGLGLTVITVPAVEATVVAKSPAALSNRWRQAALTEVPTEQGRAAQSRIPAGAAILSLADPRTAMLDLRRNPIFAADQPATVGPAGGWPRSPASPRDWLAAAGIDYVLIDPAFFTGTSGTDTAWRRGLAHSTTLAQTQFRAATDGVAPVVATDDLALYAVADLNPR